MKSHFLKSECDGMLYDTRADNWHKKPALRIVYAQHCRDIKTGAELRATLRAGEFAFPGGYQLAFITSDGGLLCFDCVRDELPNIIDSIRRDISDGWRVIACEVMHDGGSDTPCNCDHCGKTLTEPKEPDYWACTDCVSAICNDDYTGMDDDQAHATRAGLDNIGGFLSVSFDHVKTENYHAKCDVCGVIGSELTGVNK